MSSSFLVLLLCFEGSFDSFSGSKLSHLLVATTGACTGVSHLEDFVSRLRSRRPGGDEDFFIGNPSKSSDTEIYN